MSYVTLAEAAKKYNLSPLLTDRFVEVVTTQFPHAVFGNPDISASGILDQHIIKTDSLMSIMRVALAPKDTLAPTELNSLRADAINAMSAYIAEYNKINYVDFIVDCRLDPEFKPTDCPRRGFGVDSEEISDFIFNCMAEDISEQLMELQD